MTNDKKENLIDISTGFGKPRPLAVGKVHYLYKWATILLFATTLIFGTIVFTSSTKEQLKETKEQLQRCQKYDLTPNGLGIEGGGLI